MYAMHMDLDRRVDHGVRSGGSTRGCAGDAANAVSAERGIALERTTSERVRNRLTPAFAWRVEHALFAVTLAAIGYLEALALLADAI